MVLFCCGFVAVFSLFSLSLRWQLVIMCVFHNEVILMLLAHLVRTRFS